jgi:SAM-dependent methyltransferase
LATDVLEHISKPDQLWSEMRRVLRPGGRIVLGVPFFYWIHEAPHDFFRYTEFKLQAFAADHDLQVLDLRPYGGWPDVVADLWAKRLASHERLSAVYMRLINRTWNTDYVQRLSAETAHAFPLGYTMVARRPADGAC